MDFKTFLENFEVIAEAPGGIPKLRELILDLAMRGKLVPQNPDDEPASILLQKVQLNRKHLLERGKLNQKKPLKPIEKDEIPHGLPEGWNWCRFGQIIDCYRGHNPPKLEFVNEPREGYVRFIQITDFKTDGAAVYVPVSHNLKYVCKGEIAMAAYRHIGKLSRSVEGAFNVAICKVIELQPIYRDYIEKLIGSIYVKGELLAASGRAHIPSMHTEHLLSLVIPLPPLAEQKRIVEKVDELMGLCDRYEVAKQTRDNLRQKLRGSAIASLMNSETDEELDAAWAFVRDNWHNLSQQPEDVSGLRKSVLELAVRGKLVPQNSEDETAKTLHQIIKKLKEQALKEKKIQKDKDYSSIISDIFPWEIPTSWAWIRLQDGFEITRGGSPRPSGDPQFFGGNIPWITVFEITKDSTIYLTSTTDTLTELGSRRSRFVYPDDLLLTNSGATLGVPKISKIRGCINDGVAKLFSFHQCIYKEYAYYYLLQQTPIFRKVNQGMGQPNLNTSIIAGWFFPLPPLAEQKRIVVKVDELMKLCDQLEASLRQSQQQAESLAASAISHLTI